MPSSSANTTKPTRLATNFSWTLVGNALYAAAQWGIIAAIAKFGNQTELGIFSFYLAIISPVQIFVMLKLRTVIATDMTGQYSLAVYFQARIWGIASLLAYSFAVFVAFASTRQELVILVLVTLAKIFECYMDFLFGYMQRHEKMREIAISRILQSVFIFFGIGILVSLNTSSLGLGLVLVWALSSIVVSTTVATVYSLKVKATHDPKSDFFDFKTDTLKASTSVIWLAIPLGISTAVASLGAFAPNYFVKFHLGYDKLGQYAAITALIFAGVTVLVAISQAGTPRLAKLWADAKFDEFSNLTRKLNRFGCALGIALVAMAFPLAEPFLQLVYTPEYGPQWVVLVILVASFAFKASFIFYGTALNAMRVFNVQHRVSIYSLVVMLCGLWWLVPNFGLAGAAAATVLYNVTEAMMNTYYFRASLKAKAM